MEKRLWLAVGVVKKPHGVKGKISVTPLSQAPEVFSCLKEVLVGETPPEAKAHRVIRVQFMNKAVLLQLEDFDLEQATGSVGSLLWVRREQLPPLEQGEYYYQDLVGMKVVSSEGEHLGLVEGVMETGDSQVLVCRKGQRELLIPFLHGVIKQVDEQEGMLLVDLPQGLE
ncbi:MAG: ribosome maturation factor RimM [bacterium]